MTTYSGSCHCGNVAIEVEGPIDGAMACNCSMCARRASLLWFVPFERMKLKTPEAAAGRYMFHKHVIQHRFCRQCGIHVYGEGQDPAGRKMAAVNLRCFVESVDLDAIPVQHFDGRAM